MYQQFFDLNGNGSVGSNEMLVLGKARRALGQKGGEWLVGQNNALMQKMGVDMKGDVPLEGFVRHFNDTLPMDSTEFNAIIDQFILCAQTLRVFPQGVLTVI